MHEQAWQELLKKLKTNQINELTIDYNTIIVKISRFTELLGALRENQSLTKITLKEISGGMPCMPLTLGVILKELLGHPGLTEIHLSSNHLSYVDQDSQLFQIFLNCMARFEIIDLSDNNLTRLPQASLKRLYETLENNPKLRILSLHETGLENMVHWQELQAAKEKPCPATSLQLSH